MGSGVRADRWAERVAQRRDGAGLDTRKKLARSVKSAINT